MPIAGTILNPLARGQRLDEMVREFELLLSEDGQTWTSVLRDELQRAAHRSGLRAGERGPREASHAPDPLGPWGRSGRVASLGEWKVVATPGALPDPMPTNIAEGVRGGHVARVEPFIDGFDGWLHLLDDDLRARPRYLDRQVDDEMSIVIGFQEGRAAQISELRWQDPDGFHPGATGTGRSTWRSAPSGPWAHGERVTGWDLQRAPDGTVAPLILEEPVWARYVRLRSDLPSVDVSVARVPGPDRSARAGPRRCVPLDPR